jgi:hypothetical protein
MAGSAVDLLPGEQLLETRAANAVVKLSDYGLSRFAFDKYMWVAGMKGKEAIGGTLSLTSYRLVFQSHALNRLRGRYSIFLPAIVGVRDASFLWTRKLAVATPLTEFQFVVWGIPRFIQRLAEARARLTPQAVAALQGLAVEHFARWGEGLQTFGGAERINQLVLTGGKVSDLFQLAMNPFEALAAAALSELLDRTVIDPWQRPFD